MATNTDNQKEYNEELLKSQKIMAATANVMGKQAQLLIGMVASMQGMDMSKVQKQSEDLERAILGLDKALGVVSKTNKTTMSDMTDGLEKAHSDWELLTGEVNKLDKTLLALGISGAGALSGFGQGLKLSMSLTGALMDQTKHLVVALLQMGASIITAPFKILQGFINMSAVGGSNEFAIQLEEIRKEFGYLKKSGGAQIIGMFKEMRGELANTGLSVRRIFGTRAEVLKYFADYAKALGPVFDSAMNRVGEGGAEALGAFNKALGFTNEGLKAVATRSLASGVSINEINRQVANYALQLSDTFGVVQKQVTKAVGDMMADFQHFGHLSAKELTQTAVYARKLGLEIKTLGAVMDKWMNFEDAAQGAAQLSQAFGLNIDALNMMKAQNPADKIEQLRKAFFRAGKSVETMTYQERRLLTQQTGLDDAGISLAFSLKSQGTSYDQITKKGNAAQKAQLTQTQALHQLSGAIERMVKSGEGIRSGFIDTFFKGFVRGMTLTRDFRSIMRNLQKALRATLWAGRDVGRMFVRMMPGVKEFFGGLAGFFEPRRFRVLLTGVKGAFHTFFEQIAGKDPRALPNFLKNLKNSFLSFFDSRSIKGQMFLTGARKLFTSFVGIVNGLLKEAIQGVTKGVEWITKLISGEITLSSLVGNLKSTGGFFGDMLSQLIEGLPALGSRLGDAFLTLWERLKTEYGPRVISAMSTYLAGVLGVALAGAFARGFLFSVGGLMVEGLKDVFARRILRSRGISTAAEQTAQELARRSQNVPEVAATPRPRPSLRGRQTLRQAAPQTSATGTLAAITEANAAQQAADRSTANATSIKNMLKVAAIIGVGMVAIIIAMFAIIALIRRFSITLPEIVKAGVLMGASAGMMAVAAGSVGGLMAAMKFSAGSLTGFVPVMVALGAVLGAMILTGIAVVGAVKLFKFSKGDVTNAAILIGAVGTMVGIAALVAGAALGLGAIMVTTGGSAALFLAAGLASISAVIAAMVTATMLTMVAINRFHMDTGFSQKAEVFISLIRSLSSFAGQFAAVAEASRPSFLSSIFGHDTMSGSLKAVQNVILEVGDQAIRLLNTVVTQMTSLTPDQLQKATAFIGIMEGIGSFIHNLQPPANMIVDTSGYFGINNTASNIALSANYVTSTVTNLKEMMLSVLQVIQRLQPIQFNEASLSGIRAFTTIMTSMGEIIPHLMPSAGMMHVVAGGPGLRYSITFDQISKFMKNVLKGLVESKIFDSITGVVTGIVSALRNLSPDQITRLTGLMPIVTSAFGVISAVSNIVRAIPQVPPGNVMSGALAFTGFSAVINTLFESLENVLPNIINRLKTITISRGEVGNIRTSVQALKGVFEVISLLPPIINLYTRQGFTLQESIGGIVGGFTLILSSLFGTNPGGNGFALRQALQDSHSFVVPGDLKGTIDDLKLVFVAMNTLSDASSHQLTNPQVGALVTPLSWMFNPTSPNGFAQSLKASLDALASWVIPSGVIGTINTLKQIFVVMSSFTGDTPLSYKKVKEMIDPIGWMFDPGFGGGNAQNLKSGLESIGRFSVPTELVAIIAQLREVFVAMQSLTGVTYQLQNKAQVTKMIAPMLWLFVPGEVIATQLKAGIQALSDFNPVPLYALPQKISALREVFVAMQTLTVPAGSAVSLSSISQVVGTLDALFNMNNPTGTARLLETSLTALAAYHAPNLTVGIQAFQGVLFSLNTMLSTSSVSVTDMAANATRMAEQIKANTVAHIGESIQAMVTEVNNIGRSLNNINVDNVNVALRTLANDIGLGETRSLTIQRGNFTINVPISVEIKAQDLQTVLVAQSRIVTPGQRLAIQGSQ